MALVRWLVHLLFAVTVVVGAARTAAAGHVALAVITGAALGAWYVAGLVVERRVRTHMAATIWLVGLSAGVLVAMALSADFAWVSFSLFILYATVVPIPAGFVAIGASAIATGGILFATAPAADQSLSLLLGPVIGAGLAAGLAAIYRSATAELAERQALIDELVAAKADLDAVRVQTAVRAERERMAAEIHDTLAQTLTSLVMVARRPGGAGDGFGDVEALATEALDQARRLVAALPPAELDTSSLPDALVALSRDLPARVPGPHPQVSVRIDGHPQPLDTSLEAVVLRVASEALLNALRHAHASQVALTVTYGPGAVTIDVVDDGCGIADAGRSSGGYGLRGMATRVRAAGGRFDIEASAGERTAVTATLPLPLPHPEPVLPEAPAVAGNRR